MQRPWWEQTSAEQVGPEQPDRPSGAHHDPAVTPWWAQETASLPPQPWYGPNASSWGAAGQPVDAALPWPAPPPAQVGAYDSLGRPVRVRQLPSTVVLVGIAVLIALLSGAMGGAVGLYVAHVRDQSVLDGSVALPAPATGTTSRPPGSVADIAARTLPSVVAISIRTSTGGGTGSGFVIDADGYILTNNHVVAEAAQGGSLEVSFSDQRSAPATVVGTDASYDLAVIKVAAKDLSVATLGNSDDVVVGDEVIAIGAPLGLAGTVTSGIISAKNRPVTAGEGRGDASFINALQTDAAINPGNSGGPLMDSQGRVIGVNSAIAALPGTSLGATQAGSIGLGFAIPINQARRTAEQLITTGRSAHPVIGVALDTRYDGPGAKIAEEVFDDTEPITPGGPADQAGLRPGDVITKLDGVAITGNDELIVAIRAKVPGDEVSVTYQRAGKTGTARLTLGSSAP